MKYLKKKRGKPKKKINNVLDDVIMKVSFLQNVL